MAGLADLLAMITGGSGEKAYQSLAGQLASIGEQEAMTGINYERDLSTLGYNQEDSVARLHDALANRGMMQSGMAIRGEADQNRAYNTLLDQLARSRQSTMSNLAGQRVNAESAYNMQMADLATNFAGKSTEFIEQQMQADAQRRMNQQQMVYQNQMNQMNQDLGLAQQNAYKQQSDYFGNLSKSVAGLTSLAGSGATGTYGQTSSPPPTQPTYPNSQPAQPAPTLSTSRALLPTQRIPYQQRPGTQTSTRTPV